MQNSTCVLCYYNGTFFFTNSKLEIMEYWIEIFVLPPFYVISKPLWKLIYLLIKYGIKIWFSLLYKITMFSCRQLNSTDFLLQSAGKFFTASLGFQKFQGTHPRTPYLGKALQVLHFFCAVVKSRCLPAKKTYWNPYWEKDDIEKHTCIFANNFLGWILKNKAQTLQPEMNLVA